MPNCDFYAIPEDHKEILKWIFLDGSCEVYELASDFEKPLRQFLDPEEVISQFDRQHPDGEKWRMVHLQLNVIGAGPPFSPRRVSLDPDACGGATFRFTADGWGLIQLYLASPKSDHLESSHTNHNSKKRAERWSSTDSDSGGPDAWEFARISSFSSRLNRQIRKARIAKIGSRPVLPGAVRLWDAGTALWPYRPGEHTLTERKAQPIGGLNEMG